MVLLEGVEAPYHAVSTNLIIEAKLKDSMI